TETWNYPQWGSILSPDGTKVFFSGPFIGYNGTSTNDRAGAINIDGTHHATFTSLAGQVPDEVYPSVDGSNYIYMTGEVTFYNGSGARRLLKIDMTTGASDAAFHSSLG